MNIEVPLLQAEELLAAGRDVPPRFALQLTVVRSGSAAGCADGARELPDGVVRVECREVLRVLPGRRLVARVDLAGRPALMKLFFGADAERYRTREARGVRLLAAAGVATPAVLAELCEHGTTAPARGLLFEYLAGARPVPAGDDAAMAGAAAQLARLHAAGCRHDDLHLDNFLQVPGAADVFVIDGDRVRGPAAGSARPRAVGARRSLADLAVLCAQRPPLADARLPGLFAAYAAVRGWPAGPSRRLEALAAATRRARRARVRRYLDKALRDCTEFHHEASWRQSVLAVRSEWNAALGAFAADPEAALRDARVLKAGNSATVVRVALAGRSRVVKRYNLKGPWHALRRVLKPSARFRRAWLNGQRLRFLEIPTARPILLLERRAGPVRGVAYLVMEDLGDVSLADEIAAEGLRDTRLGQLAALFRALAAAGLRHGDTKASNFLIGPEGVHVVDLDAMREQRGGSRKDIERFLANFDGRPEIRTRIRAALG